jgi:catechol 2,3-dioxygenase-like lactoylglutathione lyase family enzyme
VPATNLRRVAPVFVTTDLARALAHYERLGFAVEAYDNADDYGYACRDGIEIHLAKVDELDGATTTSCAYVWVDDAAALHEEWAAAGVDGRLHAPNPTAYGLNEGAHVDPDGNLIRFGSPPVPPRALR